MDKGMDEWSEVNNMSNISHSHFKSSSIVDCGGASK